MGQPGNALINHAGVTNYWYNQYNTLVRDSSYTLFFIDMLRKLITFVYKYGHDVPDLFFYSSYFFETMKYYERKNMKEVYFRRKRIYESIIDTTMYYKSRRRVASYLNSKY